MKTIAALFVEKNGVYSTMPGVELWDEERDARKYAGPWPVVCHPPCNLWTKIAANNYRRWGGEHNRPGNDGGCFEAALKAVMQWGGVLEHPMSSRAWQRYGLLRPSGPAWERCLFRGYYVCEVWQSAYGHKATKRTWLIYNGQRPPPGLNWSSEHGTHQVSRWRKGKPVIYGKEASATPPAFAELLVSIARGAAERRCA